MEQQVSVLSGHNPDHVGRNFLEWALWPIVKHEKVIGLRANRVGPGEWRRFVESPPARDIIRLELPRPDLSHQTVEECADAVLSSPLAPQLEELVIGHGAPPWRYPLYPDVVHLEVKHGQPVIQMIERLPRLRELSLTLSLPDRKTLVSAVFPPGLKALTLCTEIEIDLGALAANRSLRGLHELIVAPKLCQREPHNFRHCFAMLVDSSEMKRLRSLHLDHPHIDLECCRYLVRANGLKRLKQLCLRGDGLTDECTAILAASPRLRALEKVVIVSRNVTDRGLETLRDAGIALDTGE